jgi:hypothetical protein
LPRGGCRVVTAPIRSPSAVRSAWPSNRTTRPQVAERRQDTQSLDIVKRDTIDAVRCLRVSRHLGAVPRPLGVEGMFGAASSTPCMYPVRNKRRCPSQVH